MKGMHEITEKESAMIRPSLRRPARDAAYIGLAVALLAVCAWIAVPLPVGVPVTLQMLGLCATVGLLGGRRGTIAVAVYLLVGGMGLPVFAGFGGGVGVLAGATGGYLLGMLPAAAIMGWVLFLLARRSSGERVSLGGYVGVFSVGVAVCYTVGTAWFAALYASETGATGIAAALSSCVLPYLLPDALKCLIAARLCCRLQGRARG